MQIDFYEEFPTDENLERLKLVRHPIRLFVATHSLEEFKELERKVKRIKKDTEVAYWPIIKNSYWISPFANRSDLEELFRELETIENLLLIDLELPLKSRRLMIKNLPYFSKNKRLIRSFLEKNKQRITTAEFPVSILSFFMRVMGLDYNVKTEKSLMWYSSMIGKQRNNHLKKALKKLKIKKDYSISLGTIATGILGNEPILSPEKLEEDLEFCKKAGFNKAIIFRLGGLNKRYVDLINKYQD